jgi:uncharacterized protein
MYRLVAWVPHKLPTERLIHPDTLDSSKRDATVLVKADEISQIRNFKHNSTFHCRNHEVFMTPEEQNLIEGLFQRLRQADTNPKDAQAEQLIRAKTAELPSATYLLVQAVLVQEHALANAQAKIADLESQLRTAQAHPAAGAGGGSFLSGVSRLFGNKPQPEAAAPPPLPRQGPVPQQAQSTPPPITVVPQSTPYPSTVNLGPSSGGSFLQSAMATAAGVAGGQLLFQGIESLIGHNAGPFGPALESRGSYPGGIGGSTEIVNNYYGTETPRSSEHQNAQSDNFIPGANEPFKDTDVTGDQDLGDSADQTDFVDADTQDSGFDLAGGDDSGFGSDDSSFSGSDDNLV